MNGMMKLGRARMGMVASAFLLMGMLFFILFGVGCTLYPQWWLAASGGQRANTLLHAALLGWLLPMGFAAVYGSLGRLGPDGIKDKRSGQLHFIGHLAALPVLLGGFATWRMSSTAHAGALLLLAFAVGSMGCLAVLERGERRPLVQISVVSSLVWLGLTLFMGTAAAANHYWSFLPMPTLTAIHSGMHAGFGGYFLLLVVGLSYEAFGMGGPPELRLWTFLLLNAGVLLSVFGIAFSLPTVYVGALAAFMGIGMFAADVWLAHWRKHSGNDAWFLSLSGGIACIIAVMALGIALVSSSSDSSTIGKAYLFVWMTGATGLPLLGVLGALTAPEAGKCRSMKLSVAVYLLGMLTASAAILAGDARFFSAGGLLLAGAGAVLFSPLVAVAYKELFTCMSASQCSQTAGGRC